MKKEKEQIDNYIAYCESPVKILAGVFLVVLTVFVGAKAVNEIKGEKKIVQNIGQNTIMVSAEGKILAKPDIGKISLGVINEEKTVGEAQKQSVDAINKTIALLKSKGVEEKDIKTTNYNIYPVYDYNRGKQSLRGYSVSQNLEVKIRDLAKSGDIVAGAANSGANVIGGLSFTIDDLDAVKEQARQQAIEKAKAKASKLADELGIKIGKLVSFNESGSSPVYYEKAFFGTGGAETASVSSVPAGENEIAITVSLTYETK